MTRFELPEGVTTGLGLVAAVRIWEGARGSISEGMVALADWIVEDLDRAGAALGDPLCPLHDRLLNRVLAGVVLPGEDHGEWLGRTTEGRVTAQLFRRSFAGAVPDLPAADAVTVPEPASPVEALCAIPGPLGTVPVGAPLFRAIVDPMAPGEFMLTGLGLGLRLSEATAGAMRRAITDGIEQVRADRMLATA